MPHRYRLTYVVAMTSPDGDEDPLCGPFGDRADAEHFAAEFCKTSRRVTTCTVRPLIPPIFVCDDIIAEQESAG